MFDAFTYCLLKQKLDKEKNIATPMEIDPTHEKYTVQYIQREAFLLVRFLGQKNKYPYKHYNYVLTDMDWRILRRWGLK